MRHSYFNVQSCGLEPYSDNDRADGYHKNENMTYPSHYQRGHNICKYFDLRTYYTVATMVPISDGNSEHVVHA